MPETPADRLLDAVGVVIDRGALGETTARRIRRAAAELGGSDRMRVIGELMVRLHNAHEAGQLDEETLNEAFACLGRGAAKPIETRQQARRPGSQREQKGRSLSHVPDGTRVVYDGLWATIRGGRMTVEGLRGTFDTPTPAARAVTGEASVNGWVKWRLTDGRTLAKAYDSTRWE